MLGSMSISIPSRFGRVLAVVAWLLAAYLLAATAVGGPEELLRAGWPPLLLAWVGWACFWHPAVVIADSGVTLRNVLRTVEVPWPAIRAVDTRYSLTLHTPEGRHSAWAAPAPSRLSVLRARPADAAHLPGENGRHGGIRPGDLTSSESGQAAYLIRQRWQELHGADLPAAGPGASGGIVIRWHRLTLAALLVLAAGMVLAVLA